MYFMCPMLMVGIVDMVRLKWVRRTIRQLEWERKQKVDWLMNVSIINRQTRVYSLARTPILMYSHRMHCIWGEYDRIDGTAENDHGAGGPRQSGLSRRAGRNPGP